MWNAELYQDANIKLSVGTSTNTEESITLMPNQWEDKPKLVVSPVISKLTAAYVKESKITNVSWELDESTPPQLTFTAEIRKDGVYGDLVISHTETSPHKRDIELDTRDLQSGTYYITFEFYDIFNQKSNFGYTSFEV